MSWIFSARRKDQKVRARFLKALSTQSAELRRVGQKTQPDWQLYRDGNACAQTWPDSFVRSAAADGVIRENSKSRFCMDNSGRMALRRFLSHGEDYAAQQRDLKRTKLERPTPDDEGPGFEHILINTKESPLTWLASRKDKKGRSLLQPEQIRAGERLRADYTFACLMPSTGPGWRTERIGSGNSSRSGSDLTDDVVAARRRVEGVLSGLGQELAGIAVDVCCHLKGLEVIEGERGWPARSGKVVLQIALSGLAERYGERTVASKSSGQI
ncbi:MAG: DUF6456 domain-containing protein [Roseibium sp.]